MTFPGFDGLHENLYIKSGGWKIDDHPNSSSGPVFYGSRSSLVFLTCTQNGAYIVYLFSEDGQNLYHTQSGYTIFIDQFGRKGAIEKMHQVAKSIRSEFDTLKGFSADSDIKLGNILYEEGFYYAVFALISLHFIFTLTSSFTIFSTVSTDSIQTRQVLRSLLDMKINRINLFDLYKLCLIPPLAFTNRMI